MDKSSDPEKLKVLIIDDEKQFAEELHEFLEKIGFAAQQAHTGQQGLSILSRQATDLLILDLRLPGIDGLEILKEVREKYPKMEVIIVSGHGDMDTVIRAMRLGAIDYLRKPFRHLDIRIAIERTQKFLQLHREMKKIEERSSLISKALQERIERNFVGVSSQILEVLDLAITASKFRDTNVLITGESGTGKENIARIIHYSSDRKDALLCAVNSSAITDSLLESEFFGHIRGSFTGALADKKGFFEVSDQGTLFLDEIADMPCNLQAKVLRAIEEKKITRVGDTKKIPVDFRIISATNHDLDRLVREKKFRLDLLHRLNTLHIHIPPLRERPEDIEPLLDYFVKLFSVRFNKQAPRIHRKAIEELKKYEFPGNVRELKNMVERALILCDEPVIGISQFPVRASRDSAGASETRRLNLKENEVETIRQALQQCSYNQKATADLLGITRDALIRKLKKYSIAIRKSEN